MEFASFENASLDIAMNLLSVASGAGVCVGCLCLDGGSKLKERPATWEVQNGGLRGGQVQQDRSQNVKK